LDIAASERLRSSVSQEAQRKRRFIVELAEDPRGAGRITGEMRRSRRRQYAESAGKIGARIIHNYGKLKNRIVVEMDPNSVEKLRRLPRFRSFSGGPSGQGASGGFGLPDQDRLRLGQRGHRRGGEGLRG